MMMIDYDDTNDDKITVVIIEYDIEPQSSYISSKLPKLLQLIIVLMLVMIKTNVSTKGVNTWTNLCSNTF